MNFSAIQAALNHPLGRSVKVLVVSIVGFFALLAGLVACFQNKLIYFPTRYDPALRPGEGELSGFIPYTADDGRRQWGLLIEPEAANPPPPRPSLYLVFYGNASTALGMADFFEELARRTGCAFYLVDYRGYGFNEGRPTEAGLTADALGAYDSMREASRFENGVGIIGISLGGGAAFAVAEQRPVDRLIAVSTFTSIDDMARLTVPWPIYHFAFNHWPNDRRLEKILSRPESERPKPIVLFHGDRDRVIPFRIGRRLAAIGGDAVRFVAVPGADHNDIYSFIMEPLAEILTSPAEDRQTSAR